MFAIGRSEYIGYEFHFDETRISLSDFSNLKNIREMDPYLHNEENWASAITLVFSDYKTYYYYLNGKAYYFDEWLRLTPYYTDEEKIEIKLRGYV